MDISPWLLPQDQADFERALSQALSEPGIRDEASDRLGEHGVDQLRTLARAGAAEIASAVTDEYLAYTSLRTAGPTPSASPQVDAENGRSRNSENLLGALAVLSPILSGAAAVILYLIGALLKLNESERRLAASITEAAWTAVIIAAVTALGGVAALLFVAARPQPVPDASAPSADPGTVERAREEWQSALVERGILPFLRSRLAD